MPSLEPVVNGSDTAPAKVLVIGGSYGGLAAALNLLDVCKSRPARCVPEMVIDAPRVEVQIKVVDKRDGYYHIIGSPLALASEEFNPKAWQRFEELPAFKEQGISHIHGSVVKIDPENKIATIVEVKSGMEYTESYDYLVAASGLSRAWPVVPQALTKADYLVETAAHIQTVKNAKDGVVVVGGGAVGVEMAAELKLVYPTLKVTLIQSRSKLLSSEPLPDEFKDRALEVLKETGVEVILNDRVTDVQPIEGSESSRLTLVDGSHLVAGHVIWALSKSVPTTTYLPDDSLDPEGYVKIAPTMQFTVDTPNHKEHFGIGDLAAWSGIKRCGGAFHMGVAAAHNIHQLLLKEQHGMVPKLREVAQFQNMIALAVGTKAVLYGPEDGVTYGEDKMQMMFGNDLGWTICWNYTGVGRDASGAVVISADDA